MAELSRCDLEVAALGRALSEPVRVSYAEAKSLPLLDIQNVLQSELARLTQVRFKFERAGLLTRLPVA